MKTQWVRYLCDPKDKSPLRLLAVEKKIGRHVISGRLKSKSGNLYEIKNGIPVLLTRNSQTTESVESFRYEWEQFDFDFGRQGWVKDIIRPTVGGTKFFDNKVVIDCGAGSGRQSRWIAEAGAKLVFSVELSNSAHTIVRKVTDKYRDKIFVIQADISQIPINPDMIKIDLLYCVNVIQHTKNPLSTLKELAGLLSKRSLLIFNIYLGRGRNFLLKIMNYLRLATKYMPKVLVKYIALFIAIITLPFYRVNGGFKERWLDVYDLIGSHEYQKFYSEDELRKMLKGSKLTVVRRSQYAMLLKRSVGFS
jgi:2-polyprenyl-3-methyl-5-hydroxy-6-metoxy-1,4-benzoquinol methylase